MTRTKAGVLAVSQGKPVKPESAQKYLESKFGEALSDAIDAMAQLAKSLPPKELAKRAFALYGKFRPSGAEATAGWGMKYELDLDSIRRLADEKN